MNISIQPTAEGADAAAAVCLAGWLASAETRNIMVAAGKSPLGLYRRIACLQLELSHLHVFALDEYVGVPPGEPRNCGNLLRRSVAEAWKIPPAQFYALSPLEAQALPSLQEHERRLEERGGLDVVILGLGQNGHLGFNEPGSVEDCAGRVMRLEESSVKANRKWFNGHHAPSLGATVGLKTILAARHVLLMAYGAHKAAAVKAMVDGPRSERCPASLLQGHPGARVFLDEMAAAQLQRRR